MVNVDLYSVQTIGVEQSRYWGVICVSMTVYRA